MGRPPVKATRALTKAKLDAEAKFALSKRGISLAIVKMIDRIDPLELLAVGATSFIVYDIIKSTPPLLAKASTALFTDIAKYSGFIQIAKWILDQMGTQVVYTSEQMDTLNKIKETPDMMLFLKSFAIAYIIVKHSGQIISGVGNITGFIGTFLGLKAV